MRKLAVCLLVGFLTSPAWALVAGFNVDIHMDIPTDLPANDFHIEGRVESGSMPQLVAVISDFPEYHFTIDPDPDDPEGLWYIFRIDFSGREFKYCDWLHLGLFFDLECHNLVIDLVGWWTRDGQRIPIPIPGIPPEQGPPNGVLIPGFEVEDLLLPADLPQQPFEIPKTPQIYRVRNDSEPRPDQPGQIPTEIVEMQLASFTPVQVQDMGGMEALARMLRRGGGQEDFPWIPVANENGPISPENSLDFPVDSFFDVMLDPTILPGQGGLWPMEPIRIQPGDVLVARTGVMATNNAGEPEFRWVWHMHEGHEADLGDAPDSTNTIGPPMTAYPPGGPPGVLANFPTVYRVGSPPHGPIHWRPRALAWLGPMVTGEMEADIGPDQDGINNLDVPGDRPDLDGADDGVLLPIQLPHCKPTQFQYLVTFVPNPNLRSLFVNVWFDWNVDGDWDDQVTCPDGVTLVPEWAVQNQQVNLGGPTNPILMTTPPFLAYVPPVSTDPAGLWMRITLSEQPWQPVAGTPGFGGSGPPQGYTFGETEDYFIPIEPIPEEFDFGDAPEDPSGASPSYPTTLANNGARHAIPPLVPPILMGAGLDPEPDGQPTAAADGDDTDGNDDEDGVVFLTPLIPGQGATVQVTVNAQACLQGWIDFNADGDWNDPGEQIIQNAGTVPGLNTFNFQVPATAAGGTTYARFRFSTQCGLGVAGPAPNGEVEDYQVEILPMDFGDAPDDPSGATPSYPTLLVNNGARHVVPPVITPLRMGALIDVEPDGQPTAGADGDDLNTSDDEDGVTFTSPLVPGTTATVDIDLSGSPVAGIVTAWVDFNADGDWDDAWSDGSEHIIVDQSLAGGSVHTVSFPVPWAATVGAQTYARFRVSTTRGLGYAGLATDGEVEDYVVTIEAPPERDWGDAPDGAAIVGYPTLRANNGASHRIDPRVFLGAAIDPDRDGQPTAMADGDDTDPDGDDEDGVVFDTWPLIPGRPARITVTASVPGFLFAWVDFNADVSWAEPGDQIFQGHPLNAGSNVLVFQVPMTAKPNCTTFARFRFITDQTIDLPFTGDAPNGEVEDYRVKIGKNCGIKWIQRPDLTANGIDIRVDGLRTLADDFLCTETGYITDVHLWGSKLKDNPIGKPPRIQRIHLSIHSDDPVGPEGSDPQNEYSKPDELLWQGDFGPDDFDMVLVHRVEDGEWWWNNPGVVPMPPEIDPTPGADTELWRVDIRIPRDRAFLQEGSEDKPVVYWLDVRVVTEEGFTFGWKTRRWPDHFNDDAVVALGSELPPFWQELRYPPNHPYHEMEKNSIDMAFAITSPDACCRRADLNCDGFVDIEDFAIFAAQWLTIAP